MGKLLTISVAAYNVEKFLNKLLDSIIAADVNDQIEVLIVNDGSKDRTVEIAKQYEEKYPDTVFLVNKENGGHGSTINKGIELAKGKYFRALDGDDWVDSDNLKKVVEELGKTDTDMVLVDYVDAYEGGEIVLCSMTNLTGGQKYEFDDIIDKIDWCTYHYTIYKTSLLKEHDIRLAEHCFYVDSEYCLFPIPYVRDVLYLDTPLYCYRLGYAEQSVSALGRKKHIVDSDTVSRRMIEFVKKTGSDVSEKRRGYMYHVTEKHLIRHYHALLLFEPTKENKQKILDFEKYVKDNSEELYGKIAEGSKICRLLRKTGYIFYPQVINYRKKKYKDLYPEED